MTTSNTTPFGVIVSPAELAEFPNRMSITSLQDIEKCPLRWSLRHSKYHWDHGTTQYPTRINPAALKGSLIHNVLEVIINTVSDSGCSSLDDPRVNDVLRDLGGWTGIINGCIDEVMKSFEGNPRVSMDIDRYSNGLKNDVPDIRNQVKGLLEDVGIKVGFKEKNISFAKRNTETNLLPSGLNPGVYTELRLQSDEIGWVGIVDLLILSESECQIVDYKTGEHSDEHAEQLRLYALLWKYNQKFNPGERLADSLILSYLDGDRHVEAPNEGELELLLSEVTQRTKLVKELVTSNPPKAIPAMKTCMYCEVRQNCDIYWDQKTQLALVEQSTDYKSYIDIELKVSGKTGLTWNCIITTSRDLAIGSLVNLRINRDLIGFDLKEGTTIRVLGAYTDSDETRSEGDLVSITVGSTGEVFLLPASQLD